MDSENGEEASPAAPERPAIERDAFDRDREAEWASINREKLDLKKQNDENSQIKQRLMSGIAEYFFKKAELEGGLIPAPEAPDDNPQAVRPQVQPESDPEDQRPPKRKRGRPRKDKQPVSLTINGKEHMSGMHSASTVSPTQFADDEGDEDGQLEPVPEKKRGRPGLDKHVETGSVNEQGRADSAVKTSPGPAKKKGRPKLYHHTDYGTNLPLTYLLSSGAVLDAEQVQTRRSAHWEYVLRFIKDRQVAAKFRVRAWLEQRSKDCMMCFVDLRTKSAWEPGCENHRACKVCQKSGRPCIVLDPTGTTMIVLPRAEEFQVAS